MLESTYFIIVLFNRFETRFKEALSGSTYSIIIPCLIGSKPVR
jgi:hypothetical protein